MNGNKRDPALLARAVNETEQLRATPAKPLDPALLARAVNVAEQLRSARTTSFTALASRAGSARSGREPF